MKGCLGLILALLAFIAVGGLWEWYQGKSAADAYEQAAKERVPATIVSAAFQYGPQNLESPAACAVTVTLSDRTVTTDADPGSGACDDNTPLRPGTAATVEIYQGKITAIYLGDLSWPTVDNPGQANLYPQAATFFAVVLAVPVAALLIIDVAVGGLVNWLRRRGRQPARSQSTPPAATEASPPNWDVYPPE